MVSQSYTKFQLLIIQMLCLWDFNEIFEKDPGMQISAIQ